MKDFNDKSKYPQYFSDLYQRIDAVQNMLSYECRSMGVSYSDVHKDLSDALSRLEEEVAQREANGAEPKDFSHADHAISELEEAADSYKKLLEVKQKYIQSKTVYPKMIP